MNSNLKCNELFSGIVGREVVGASALCVCLAIDSNLVNLGIIEPNVLYAFSLINDTQDLAFGKL